MRAVVVGNDLYLRDSLAQMADAVGYEVVRAQTLDEVIRAMQEAGSVAILDVQWAMALQPGAIREVVKAGQTIGNKVLCLCPDEGDDLREMAKLSRADKVFSRFEMRTRFREYLGNLMAA